MSRRSRRLFESLVADALDELPGWVQEAMDNVAVVVEDANAEEPELLGLYEGIPLTERADYFGVLPDRIAIYRLP
ncbi:MAG: metallopeptidase family protein, partial [Actinomycetota bacterium]|nr:metallopeptidase family protein [Actinomycetota bacterium]